MAKKIRKKARDRIIKSFQEEGTYDYAIKNDLTYSELVNRLNDKIRSYKSYYADTANITHLLSTLESVRQAAQTRVLKDIFGEEILNKLSMSQLKFIGLDMAP